MDATRSGVLPRDTLLGLNGDAFICALDQAQKRFWSGQGTTVASSFFVARSRAEIAKRLAHAVYNELRLAELCAEWVRDVPDVNVRMSLAKQSWQEFRHYKMVCDRTRGLGIDPRCCEPTAMQREFMSTADGYEDWLQRLAFMQYASERCSTYHQNEEMIAVAEEVGDRETAALYRDHIQPDERFHGQIGVAAIRDHASDRRRRAAVIDAVERFLDVRQRIFQVHHQRAVLTGRGS